MIDQFIPLGLSKLAKLQVLVPELLYGQQWALDRFHPERYPLFSALLWMHPKALPEIVREGLKVLEHSV